MQISHALRALNELTRDSSDDSYFTSGQIAYEWYRSASKRHERCKKEMTAEGRVSQQDVRELFEYYISKGVVRRTYLGFYPRYRLNCLVNPRR